MSRKLHAKPKPQRARSSKAGLKRAMAAPFRGILRDAKALVRTDDPLAAEILASSAVGIAHGVSLVDDDLQVAFAEALTKYALEDNSREALALLLAVTSIGPSGFARIAARGADAMQRSGVEPPGWARMIGPTRFSGAWCATEPYGDQDILIVAFDREGRPPHALQLLLDHNLGDMIKDVAVAPSPLTLVDAWRKAMPDLTFQSITAALAAGIIAAGLRVSDSYGSDSPASDDYRAFRALVAARSRDLPQPEFKRAAREMSPPARQKLVESFLSSPEGRRELGSRFLAETMVDFKVDYGDGDPLRWSPTVVELYMCDWFPRKVSAADADIDRLPSVLSGWVRFCGSTTRPSSRPDRGDARSRGSLQR